MTDIVKELRQASLSQSDYRWEAADEIERLRAALRDIRDMGPMTMDDQRWRIAKNALEGKHD